MQKVDAGEWALRLAIAIVDVLVQRDSSIAEPLEEVIKSFRGTVPDDDAARAIEAALNVIAVARKRADQPQAG